MREHKFYFLFSLLFGDVIVILQQKSNTMFAIFINIAAIIGGSIIGGLTKRKVNEQYLNALSTGMGIAVLVLGIYLAIQDMQKSTTPVLFIMCLAFGGVSQAGCTYGALFEKGGQGYAQEHGLCQSRRWYYDGRTSMLRGYTGYGRTYPKRDLRRRHLPDDGGHAEFCHLHRFVFLLRRRYFAHVRTGVYLDVVVLPDRQTLGRFGYGGEL